MRPGAGTDAIAPGMSGDDVKAGPTNENVETLNQVTAVAVPDSSVSPITVGIPTYGRGDRVGATLQRILACEPRPAEIIVHFDGGDEFAGTILRQFPGVRVITSSTRVGPGGGRHRCLMAARHPIFVTFDDDSYPVDAGFFREVMRILAAHADVAVLEAVITHRGQVMAEASAVEQEAITYTGCGHAMRCEAYRAVSGYVDQANAYGIEEADVSLQLHAAGWKILRCRSLRVFHDTALQHHVRPEIVAHTVQNVALLAFLRYPVALWPRGGLQFANKIWDSIARRRFRGIGAGVFGVPAVLWRFRASRRPLHSGAVRSYHESCRALAQPRREGAR